VKLLRSWPASVPEGRSHVIDSIKRLVIDQQHYGRLTQIDDDVLLLEWDVAAGREELLRFAELAQGTPGRVLVAPYRIYPAAIWAHRSWDGVGAGTISPNGARPVETGDLFCNLFGFGMVYLPRGLIRRYAGAGWSTHFGDVQFSMWHHAHIAREVPIAWNVRPVHLNYLIPELGDSDDG
jgi:hypothetical protein